jgi:hypothetical protein
MAKFQEFDVNWGVALFLSPVVTVKTITNLIERLHAFPRDQLYKSHGGHVGVPDKRV